MTAWYTSIVVVQAPPTQYTVQRKPIAKLGGPPTFIITILLTCSSNLVGMERAWKLPTMPEAVSGMIEPVVAPSATDSSQTGCAVHIDCRWSSGGEREPQSCLAVRQSHIWSVCTDTAGTDGKTVMVTTTCFLGEEGLGYN